jgi:BirA family biotin operon repressor/biotin-[acetyl-CoA-carboxylase] ligase
MFHAPDLLHELTGLRFAHPIYVYQQIGSTNDQARQFAAAGGPEGLLVVADEQTAGRGRRERRWLTPPGTALALSVVMRPALPAARSTRLVMVAGLAVCDAVEQTAGLRPALKWPNDVLIGGRKAAGILVESALAGEAVEYAVAGIGLNVSWAPGAEDVDFPATCLEAEAGRVVGRRELLRAVLAALEARYLQLDTEALYLDWRAHLAYIDTPVELRTETEVLAGRIQDVDPDGALVFRTEAGEARHVLAGDVHLRPAQP